MAILNPLHPTTDSDPINEHMAIYTSILDCPLMGAIQTIRYTAMPIANNVYNMKPEKNKYKNYYLATK